MILKTITPPATEPIDQTDIERQCRIDDLSAESEIIDIFIGAVRTKAESITRRALISQTLELVLDAFPSCGIAIPKPPLQTVESIKYIDTAGVEQTLDPAYYTVDADSEPARIVPAYGYSWPSTLGHIADVRVRFICGYGPIAPATENNVPLAIKQWMLLNVANLYENRETVIVGRNSLVEISTFADSLIESYRVFM